MIYKQYLLVMVDIPSDPTGSEPGGDSPGK